MLLLFASIVECVVKRLSVSYDVITLVRCRPPALRLARVRLSNGR